MQGKLVSGVKAWRIFLVGTNKGLQNIDNQSCVFSTLYRFSLLGRLFTSFTCLIYKITKYWEDFCWSRSLTLFWLMVGGRGETREGVEVISWSPVSFLRINYKTYISAFETSRKHSLDTLLPNLSLITCFISSN